MRQQINLYQPIFSAERKPLSARMVGVVAALMVVGLATYSTYANRQVQSLGMAVDALRSQQEAHAAQLAEFDENTSSSTLADVEARVKKLEAALEERRTALEVLQSGAAGQPLGFAARLEALARRHVEGLWIEKLVMSGANGSMSLSGSALDAATVPTYLQNLARDATLSGTRFDEFVIERPVRDTSAIDDSATKKADAAPKHIRFRAGNRALDSGTALEGAT